MRIITRNLCSLTQIEDLEPLYTFKQFPVFMGCSKDLESEDLHADMTWMISKNSGLIQLGELLPLDVLYKESHGAGCIGDLWNKHHKAFAEFIHQYNSTAIFEIGGSHGILANEYCKKKKIRWTILEPNPVPISGSNAHFIKGFFDEKFKYSDPFETVVHSHLLEHIYEPDKFMNHLSDFMDNGKYLIFSVPNLKVMLERKYTNCLNFEHTLFLTEPYLDYLLAKHGFRLVQKEYFMEDHSIFYAAIKDSSIKPKNSPSKLYEKNKKIFQDYVFYYRNLVFKLNNNMQSASQDIYLFGAHIFAQFIIAFGLDTNHIKCILDNDPNKHDKRLYGTSLMVKSPKILKNAVSPIVILKAGVYNEEIKRDIIENINTSVVFWE